MRKLISREESERLRKRNQVVVGLILAFLMIASTVGFAVQDNLGGNSGSTENSDKVTYNGFEFSYINNFWVFDNFVFRYNPKEVPDVGDSLKNIEEYRGKVVYIHSEDATAEAEVYVNLAQVAERVQGACLENTKCVEDLPIKNCNDNFIIIRESVAQRISQANGCVYIEGEKEDIVKLTDQFLFKVLGIR